MSMQNRSWIWLALCSLSACSGVSVLGWGRDGRGGAEGFGAATGDLGGVSGENDVGLPTAASDGIGMGGATAGGTSSAFGQGGEGPAPLQGGRVGTVGTGAGRGGSAGSRVAKRTSCDNLPAFDNLPEISLAGTVDAVLTRDFNHDGKLDLAVLSDGSSSISILPGLGDGTVGPGTDYALSGATVFVAGDVNADGNTDLIAATDSAPSAVSVFLGRADGTFVTGPSLQVSLRPRSLVLDDFNSDHVLDLGVFDADSGNFSLRPGNGDGTFGAEITTDGTLRIANAGDLNADGAADLVYADSSLVVVSLNNGDGTFASSSTYPAGLDDERLWIRDFDGDGKVDVLVETDCNPAEEGLFFLRGHGDGTLEPSEYGGWSCDSGSGIESGIGLGADFNGDGNFDLLDIRGPVVFGHGDGTFDSVRGAALPAVAAAIGDFDGDGLPDVVTRADNQLAIMLGDGHGAFGPNRSYFVGGHASGALPDQVLLEDVDLDGHLDIIIANPTPGSVSVMYGAGDGSFSGDADYPFDETGFTATADVDTTRMDIVSTELNHDGRPDFILLDEAYSNLGILLSEGSSYTLSSILPMGDGASAAAVADFNGDGNLDVITSNWTARSVSVRLGNGNGTFGERVDRDLDIPDGDAPDAMAAGDLNGDGQVDIVVSAINHGATVLLGRGDGTFTTAGTYSVDGSAVGLVLADLDGDGVLDMIVSTETAPGGIRVFHGVGDGTFGAEVPYDTGRQSIGLSVFDVDGDGNLDIVLGGEGLAVLFGRGDGTFPCLQTYATNDHLGLFTMGDVNGDGRLDVVGLGEDQYATVYLNPGP